MTGGFPLGDQSWASAPTEASGGPLLAPPLLQRPAHPHGHHGRVAIIELHDEWVALQRSGEAETGNPQIVLHYACQGLFAAWVLFFLPNSPVRCGGQRATPFHSWRTEARPGALESLRLCLVQATCP